MSIYSIRVIARHYYRDLHDTERNNYAMELYNKVKNNTMNTLIPDTHNRNQISGLMRFRNIRFLEID